MKNNINLWLFAALMCGLSLGVSSCKDDDNVGGANEEEKQAEEAQEQADIFWGVVSHLTGASAITSDYQDKTFEAIIGQASESNPQERIVATNDLATAVSRFNDLIGQDKVSETTTEYTWEDAGVGRLTYRKSSDGKSWATVDVNIKQVPGLERIVYAAPSQLDENAAFTGTAYYHFGDVISRKNKDGNDEYWICVRPAFGPEEKDHTHWISISPLPKDNVWTYKGSNDIQYALPTGLGYNKEHAQNFAEMLYAITNPYQWERNIINNPQTGMFSKGVPMFHDFDKANMKYHNQYFWQRVQDGWTAHGIFTKHFGSDYTADYFKEAFLPGGPGLYLLTHGYSWWTKSSNSPTLYRWHFTNGEGNESNMHHLDPGTVLYPFSKVSAEVINAKIKLNVNDQYAAGKPYLLDEKFFGTSEPHFIIRYAQGSELAENGEENQYLRLRGTEDVYNYNTEYGITDLNVDPEVLDRPMGKVVNIKDFQNWYHYRGAPHYRFGDIYKDENGHKWIVLLMAGTHFVAEPTKNRFENYGDSTCFAELISFDGLTPSADGRKITNLPTRDQVMRAAPILQSYQLWTVNKRMKREKSEMNLYEYAHIGEIIFNQVETCNFDVRMLFQVVRAQQEYFWEREPSLLASFAYNDPTDNSGKQRLLRFVENSQNAKREPMFYFWEHYVTKPDSVTELYADSLYGNNAIYLQDIASTDMVGLYGEDSYARQPIYSWDSWDEGVGIGPARKPRTAKDVDAKAEKATNYYYDKAKWRDRTFPSDMWNAPVLMFRMTAVYDRGDLEYGTITVDGHKLTPLKVRDWKYDDGYDTVRDAWEESLVPTYYSIWTSVMCNSNDTFWLDGKRINWPDPFQTWSR